MLTSHAFTSARIAVLELLAAQAAISLEKTRLYSDLAEREAKVRRLGVAFTSSSSIAFQARTTILDTGGDAIRADLVIGADGFRSGVREQFTPEVQPIYAGYVVWR